MNSKLSRQTMAKFISACSTGYRAGFRGEPRELHRIYFDSGTLQGCITTIWLAAYDIGVVMRHTREQEKNKETVMPDVRLED